MRTKKEQKVALTDTQKTFNAAIRKFNPNVFPPEIKRVINNMAAFLECDISLDEAMIVLNAISKVHDIGKDDGAERMRNNITLARAFDPGRSI